ncbi:hypothetical protein [Streptomyces sp. 1222.5]|uniref:hypothetical protein n=1 Tax=Streptomyces sp. 1222.5 TaxID=1881026 RepID=UPI003D73EE54
MRSAVRDYPAGLDAAGSRRAERAGRPAGRVAGVRASCRVAAVPGPRGVPFAEQKALLMSEQDSRADDFPRWLADQGTDAYALAWVGADNDPLRWMTAPAPAIGRTGADRPGADPSRLVLQEITHGRPETLRRWLQLEGDSTHEPLAIIGTADGRLCEYTPGELVAQQLRAPGNGDVQLTQELADWVYRRQAQAPQGLELGWTAAAAAWSWYLRDVAVALPSSVLARSLALAGEEDDAVGELMVATTLTMAGLYDRLEHGHHDGRAGFVDDWHAIEVLAADVPELREPAGWLLDQIARRDAAAQQLRAVLEPDITDYLHDRTLSDQQPHAAKPRLDGPRTAHLAQAHETVRAYTAAAYSGREDEAQQLLDTSRSRRAPCTSAVPPMHGGSSRPPPAPLHTPSPRCAPPPRAAPIRCPIRNGCTRRAPSWPPVTHNCGCSTTRSAASRQLHRCRMGCLRNCMRSPRTAYSGAWPRPSAHPSGPARSSKAASPTTTSSSLWRAGSRTPQPSPRRRPPS